MTELGLFPLRLVLFPGERLPLHIFEPRYRELIGEAIEQDGEFGILLAEDQGVRSVGTAVVVAEVVEQLPDGRLNIVVEGRSRFRVLELTTGRSFLTARVEPVEDEPDTADAGDAERAVRLLEALAATAGVEIDLPEPGADLLSFAVAARVEMEVDDEQELLELRSERERLVRLGELLEEATARAKLEGEVREKAKTNGHLPHKPELP